ncbi:MAG: KpsF/GutQ family sugar-phosphate isomerase [Nitrospirae bacterium]|nr:KpsF/GutQ family sugar-phosphate isomerase [Nitrospirota bacterium]
MITPEILIETAKSVLKTEAEAILALSDRINGGFLAALDLITESRGKCVVTGMGKSGIIGKKIAATLASTGTPAFFMHPAEASHGDLGMITYGDVIIAISNSGETEELLRLIPFFKRFDVGIISMTGNSGSTLARAASVAIDISVKEEACPLGIVPTSSTTAAIAMGDAIAVALLIKRGFKREDFAFFHPGGSLGKRLFIKVKDLMYTGDALPYVEPSTSLVDTIVEMSSRRLGLAVVVDKACNLLGIITDGDLRRAMGRWGKNSYDMSARDIMTEHPRTISEEELAAKALSVMQTHSITSLVVAEGGHTEHNLRVTGVIHLHDILKNGII